MKRFNEESEVINHAVHSCAESANRLTEELRRIYHQIKNGGEVSVDGAALLGAAHRRIREAIKALAECTAL